jgi:protein-S-isoprenylcysteine O-methyltransferase Ste14
MAPTYRWLVLAVLLACSSISAYHRYRARREGETIPRRRESALLRAGRVLVALPLFLGILTYVVNPRWMAWAELPLPAWMRWSGAALGLLSPLAAVWVFTSLGRNVSETVLTKADHELVTHGPYRWVRHPLYTTGLALLFAIGLMSANGFILSFAFIALVSIRLGVIPLEERELMAKFGLRYREYREHTGALWPRAFRRLARQDSRT